MAYSYQEMMFESVQAIQAPLCPFPTFWPKKSKFLKKKKIPGNIIILHWCTKYHSHMIFNSQNVMWMALQVILAICDFQPVFCPKKQNFLKKKKAPGYIIILHRHLKNYNHFMYTSLKMMPTALHVILGQFLPFYSIFASKLKFSKNEKMSKTY